MDEELVGGLYEETDLRERVGGKVADVVSHDDVGSSRETGCDDVAVALINDERYKFSKSLRVSRHCLGKGRFHVFASASKPVRLLGLPVDQALDKLVEDRLAPGGPK